MYGVFWVSSWSWPCFVFLGPKTLFLIVSADTDSVFHLKPIQETIKDYPFVPAVDS